MNCVRLCSRERTALSARNRSKTKYQDSNRDGTRCSISGAHAIRARATLAGARPSRPILRHVSLAGLDLPNNRFPIARYTRCPILGRADSTDFARRSSRPELMRLLATSLFLLLLTGEQTCQVSCAFYPPSGKTSNRVADAWMWRMKARFRSSAWVSINLVSCEVPHTAKETRHVSNGPGEPLSSRNQVSKTLTGQIFVLNT